jgi:hypothetical protein
MGYLDEQMEQSNAALRNRFQNSPVVPNYTPPPAAGPVMQEFDRAQAAQRAYQQANPVIGNDPQTPRPQSFVRTDAPGGGYLKDQMNEAGIMWDQGNKAGAAGAAIRGLATSPVVAVGESFQRVGQEAAPLWDAAGRFARGALGMDPYKAPNAVPGPSVQVPRGPQGGQFAPTNEGPLGVGVAAPPPQAPRDNFGPNQSVQVPTSSIPTSGPISSMMGQGMRDEAQARAVIGNPYINAELQRIQANENQGQQDKMNAMQRNVGYAQAWTQQRDAESNARVANFAARNGADMVLSGGISRNQNPQQQAILANQKNANESLMLANANMTNAVNPKPAGRDYITETNRQQLTEQKGMELAGRGDKNRAEASKDMMDVASKKQAIELQQRLMNAKTPEERKQIEDMLVALHGRTQPQDKVAVIDVDTGQKDMMGQPIYKKAAVNVTTGQIIGDPGNGKHADPVGALKSMGVEQAHAAAKKAIAEGKKLADVNALLKQAGYPTL